MSLPRHLFDPAFRYKNLGSSFAIIVGVMVFIASFAAAAESALLAAGYLWGNRAETRITVEIPAIGDEASMTQAERVKQAISILQAMPEVGLAIPLSDEEVERLLQPWFAKRDLIKSLPLPTLIDVERNSGTTISADKIEASVKTAIVDARAYDHGDWIKDVWRLVRGLSILGFVTIALTAGTLVIAVSLICRAVMAAEHETISLLHLLGAEDTDIARHFQMHTGKIAIKASGIGFASAMLVVISMLLAARHLADFSTLGGWHWVGITLSVLIVPVTATIIVAFTARASVMSLIKSCP